MSTFPRLFSGLCAALLCAAGLAALEPGYLWIGGAALLALW